MFLTFLEQESVGLILDDLESTLGNSIKITGTGYVLEWRKLLQEISVFDK